MQSESELRPDVVLDYGLENIGISGRIAAILETTLNIVTVRQLLKHNLQDLANQRNLGAKAVADVAKALASHGFATPGYDVDKVKVQANLSLFTPFYSTLSVSDVMMVPYVLRR